MFAKIINSLSIYLTILTLFPASFTAHVYANEAANIDELFSDMPTGWSREAMISAVEHGFLKGYNGLISPKDYLSRAELATVVIRAFGYTDVADISHYIDVETDSWYAEDLARAVGSGYIAGGRVELYPFRDATREEVFVTIARAVKLPTTSEESVIERFEDYKDVSYWATATIATAVDLGYMSGSGGLLLPQAKITREEFAYVLFNFSEYYANPAFSDQGSDDMPDFIYPSDSIEYPDFINPPSDNTEHPDFIYPPPGSMQQPDFTGPQEEVADYIVPPSNTETTEYTEPIH